jgi:CRP/FNR family transcriptional regulator, dissimilatory nitrate respiration regulator
MFLRALGIKNNLTISQRPRCNSFFHVRLCSMEISLVQTDILLKRLQSFEFLRGLDQKVIAALAASANWKVYPQDSVIFWEGNIESNLFYLQYGWLKVIKSGPDGREQILRFLGPGEIFNEIGVFAKRPNPATAMALEESGIWLIPRTALEQVLFTHPHTALQIMENMAERFISLVALTADLSLRTVEARLAKMLLEQAEDCVISRQRWATQSELAAHLGTVPDVLSRILRELAKAGLVEIDKQQIRILNRTGLAKRAMMQDE